MYVREMAPMDETRYGDAGDRVSSGGVRPISMGSMTGSSTTYGAPTRTAVPTGTRLQPPTPTSTPTSQPTTGYFPHPVSTAVPGSIATPQVQPTMPTQPQVQPPPPNIPPGTQAITGNESPYTVNPGTSAHLQGILDVLRKRAMGGTQLGGMMQQEAMRQLQNPSVYDDELMQSAIEQGKRSLSREFAGLREGLSSELGNRGLEYSSHASGRFGDLAAQQGYAMQDLMNNILRERAASIGSSRAAAFQNALGLEGQGFQQGSSLANLMGAMEAGQRDEQRGERSYVDNLRRQGRSDAIDETLLAEDLRRSREGEMADWMRMSMADNPGTGDLWGGADAYGQDAAQQYQLLAQLAAMYGAQA